MEKTKVGGMGRDNSAALWNGTADAPAGVGDSDSKLGPKEAFERIVKRHMKDAYLIALGLVGNREDALELSQEAFFRAYQHYDTLHSQGKFFPWFYQILRNLCFSHLRKRRLRKASSLDDTQFGCPEPQGNDSFEPDAIAERNEAKDRIWKAMGRLDDKHREVILLRHFRNLSYDEMAKVLFCNRGTVTSRLFYARQQLKEILDDQRGAPIAPREPGEPVKGGQTS
ncbi:MAG TPA: sigma-70 family RNA polymerase sigma factor [Sedimentisphaerales bacterium]|nr:sigma-70 family RNA polymerase sigma factor [Phycisphaerae bacterium]HON90827.1 sigma-70 family RNA polymerase sigma factor [Sedimentisphaerales bacterium]HQG48300.1 sigma-70 family RNA polymerase sigma factor [Sedimentisphaerales bacterium]HQI27986.1 sigma-70 family RNA polymerase sigma factor [Sedimentisphaerales bacterium]